MRIALKPFGVVCVIFFTFRRQLIEPLTCDFLSSNEKPFLIKVTKITAGYDIHFGLASLNLVFL